jgi:hypothetical protein
MSVVLLFFFLSTFPLWARLLLLPQSALLPVQLLLVILPGLLTFSCSSRLTERRVNYRETKGEGERERKGEISSLPPSLSPFSSVSSIGLVLPPAWLMQ